MLLTGRSEGFIRGKPDMDETIRRLKAYSAAGADCLYAPGISTREQISAVVKAVAPKPVNLLMGAPSDLTVKDITELGVRRISVGGSLARAAWGGFIRAAKTIILTTRGFGDTLEIGRMRRQTAGVSDLELTDFHIRELYRPLVPRERVLEIDERIDANGRIVTPLDQDGARTLTLGGRIRTAP